MKINCKNEILITEFEKTDDRQWTKRIGEDDFSIINVSLYENYYVLEIEVNLLKLTEEEIVSNISVYYDSLEELMLDYPTTWKQFVAETIADHTEADKGNDKCFNCKDTMIKYLKETYNIDYNE